MKKTKLYLRVMYKEMKSVERRFFDGNFEGSSWWIFEKISKI